MVKIAVAGSNEFVVGFQLAGIKDIIEMRDSPFSELKELKNRKDIGIVVVDEKLMEGMDAYQRQVIEASADPVFVPLSIKVEQGSLRRLIKKSIGVDLWK